MINEGKVHPGTHLVLKGHKAEVSFTNRFHTRVVLKHLMIVQY